MNREHNIAGQIKHSLFNQQSSTEKDINVISCSTI
jgi:hypothetical protein